MVIRSRYLLFLFLLLTGGMVSYSQTGSIKGMVFDKSNGDPIDFAAVLIKGTNHGTITNDKGVFSLDKIPVGDYEYE